MFCFHYNSIPTRIPPYHKSSATGWTRFQFPSIIDYDIVMMILLPPDRPSERAVRIRRHPTGCRRIVEVKRRLRVCRRGQKSLDVSPLGRIAGNLEVCEQICRSLLSVNGVDLKRRM